MPNDLPPRVSRRDLLGRSGLGLGLLGRAFVDAGALTQGPSGPNISNSGAARVGVGVGISWRSPFGLINIDLAKAVAKQSYDVTQIFRFGFGTRF
jgi:outer membrane protein insertion porin family